MSYRHDIPHIPVSAGVIQINSKWEIDSVNRQAEEMIGIGASELVGRPVADVFSAAKGYADMTALFEPVSEGKVLTNIPIRLCETSGSKAPWIIATIIPLPEKNNRGTGTIIYLANDTEQSNIHNVAMSNLTDGMFSDNSFPLSARLILEAIGDGVFTVDKQWKITSFNTAAEKITGWTADMAIGRSCSEVFQASICGKSCAIAESLYSGRTIANRSITITNNQGLKIPVSISASPLADHEGNIIGGVQTFRDLSALTSPRKQLRRKYRFDEIVSKSKAMQRLFTILPEVASSPSTVLVYGESGTGKELIATAMYNISDRKDGPFVALNCGALPESLLESELFGYKAGAFTDAKTDKPGRLAAAEGGILFLDEIGDIPTSVQVKLLRVLQEKVYEPLGSNTPVKTDIRIITATNHDLRMLVKEGRFREDLYYRLNVVRINLPPLRERKEDIPLLIEQFVKEFSAKQGKDIVGISNPALNVLMRHDFPGNIRELKNIIEYAFILCEGGYILQEHLPEPFNKGTGPDSPIRTLYEQEPQRRMTLEEVEKQAIFLALENNNWKKADTCEELRISKDTLRRKMIKFNLQRPLENEANTLI